MRHKDRGREQIKEECWCISGAWARGTLHAAHGTDGDGRRREARVEWRLDSREREEEGRTGFFLSTLASGFDARVAFLATFRPTTPASVSFSARKLQNARTMTPDSPSSREGLRKVAKNKQPTMTSQAGPESHEDNVHDLVAHQRHEDGLQKLRTRIFFPVDQIGEQLARLQTGGAGSTATLDHSGMVYCTAVLEVFCQHVLEKAVDAAADDTFWTKRHKEDSIIPRYVQLAMRKDPGVLALLKDGKGGSKILSVMNRFLDSSTAKVLSELELLDEATEELVNGELSLDSSADEGTLKQIHDKTVGNCESKAGLARLPPDEVLLS